MAFGITPAVCETDHQEGRPSKPITNKVPQNSCPQPSGGRISFAPAPMEAGFKMNSCYANVSLKPVSACRGFLVSWFILAKHPLQRQEEKT
jgi:hypothetical protein